MTQAPESYEPEHAEPTYPLLSDKTYDLLKRFQLILLPGLATFVAGLMQMLDLEGVEKVTGGAVLLGTFIGVVLLFAGKSYSKAIDTGTALDGTMDITETPEGQPNEYVANFTSLPRELDKKSMVLLKVRKS